MMDTVKSFLRGVMDVALVVIPLSVVGVTYMFVAVKNVTPSIPYSGPRLNIGILHAA